MPDEGSAAVCVRCPDPRQTTPFEAATVEEDCLCVRAAEHYQPGDESAFS